MCIAHLKFKMAHNPDPTHQGVPHIGLKNDSGMSTWSRQTIETQFRVFWTNHLDLSGLEIVRMGDGILEMAPWWEMLPVPQSGHNLTALQGNGYINDDEDGTGMLRKSGWHHTDTCVWAASATGHFGYYTRQWQLLPNPPNALWVGFSSALSLRALTYVDVSLSVSSVSIYVLIRTNICGNWLFHIKWIMSVLPSSFLICSLLSFQLFRQDSHWAMSLSLSDIVGGLSASAEWNLLF